MLASGSFNVTALWRNSFQDEADSAQPQWEVSHRPPRIHSNNQPICEGSINSINGTPELDKVVRGSVCGVERLNYDKGQYYQISVDYGYDRDSNVEGSIYGSFQPNPKTQIVNSVAIGDTIIDVSSEESEGVSGFEDVKPMVFAGIYPVDTEDYEELRSSMDKLQLQRETDLKMIKPKTQRRN